MTITRAKERHRHRPEATTAHGFRLVKSVEDLRTRIVGRAVVGESFAAWCATPRLVGTIHFGVRTAHDSGTLAKLYALSDHPELEPPLWRVVDGRFLDRIEEDAWSFMVARVGPVTERLGDLFERQAVIVPPGVRGAKLAGLLGALGPGDKFRTFTDAPAAYAWAAPDGGAAAHTRVEQLLAMLVSRSPLVRVQAWVAAHLADATVDGCARALGTSARSLQRALHLAGHSFRSVLLSARSEAAAALLASPDTKVESVARLVGASSSSHLARMLKRAGSSAPSKLRRSRSP